MPHGPGHGSVITLFVGDNDIGLAEQAQKYDARAFLVDSSNWKKIVQNQSDRETTIFTSLADLPKIDRETHALWDIICIADKIFYCPPTRWSDDTGGFSWTDQKCLVEYYLHLAHKSGRTVVGLDLDRCSQSPYLELVDKRIDDGRCLWISGCSVSHGVGVNPRERYGALVGDALGLPTVHLTRAATSIEWAADQILRSDIRARDLIIWGLTQETRGPLARDGKILVLDDSRDLIAQRLDETRYYKAISSVNQVINVSRKIGCQLILLPLLCSEKLQMDLLHHPEFHSMSYRMEYVDLGADDQHPGPLQHKIYADFCLGIIT